MSTNEIDSVSNLDLISQATDIVSAYVSNNAISPADLPGLLKVVHAKLGELAESGTSSPRPDPAVPINKSVTDHHIICLEDGAKLKMLKRYLRTHYDMSPDEYRARWGLPADYPMVAPEYARRRSDFAKKIGLGKKGR
ncbi:MAG: MucR family transcriptional regulator [Hyphomonas sp.]|nr:MucR family transcriptional regulator [Hyphomonas sp.]